MLYKLAHFAGCRMTDNPEEPHHLVVRFEDKTDARIDNVISRLAERTQVLNLRCTDISKTRVDTIFTQVFGYSVMIDPLTHTGQCVEKSDKNFTKDGKVIACPIRQTTPGNVYQRAVNNLMGTLSQDMSGSPPRRGRAHVLVRRGSRGRDPSAPVVLTLGKVFQRMRPESSARIDARIGFVAVTLAPSAPPGQTGSIINPRLKPRAGEIAPSRSAAHEDVRPPCH